MIKFDEAVARVKDKAAGPRASAAWLTARGLYAPSPKWHVTIEFGVTDLGSDTRLHVAISSTEWGFVFRHGTGTSWIRVTNAPIIHETDDFGLLAQTPVLRNLGTFVHALEDRFQVEFRRQHAEIRTNLGDVNQKILLWVIASL